MLNLLGAHLGASLRAGYCALPIQLRPNALGSFQGRPRDEHSCRTGASEAELWPWPQPAQAALHADREPQRQSVCVFPSLAPFQISN